MATSGTYKTAITERFQETKAVSNCMDKVVIMNTSALVLLTREAHVLHGFIHGWHNQIF